MKASIVLLALAALLLSNALCAQALPSRDVPEELKQNPPRGTHWDEDLGVFVLDEPIPVGPPHGMLLGGEDEMIYYDDGYLYYVVPQMEGYYPLTKFAAPPCQDGQPWILTSVLLAPWNSEQGVIDDGKITVLTVEPGDCVGDELVSVSFTPEPFDQPGPYPEPPEAAWQQLSIDPPIEIHDQEFWVAWDYAPADPDDGSFYTMGNFLPGLPPEDLMRFFEMAFPPCPEMVLEIGPWMIRAMGHCLPPENTPEGEDVVVAPVDETTGGSPVQLTYDNVIESGTTTLITSGTGPPVPEGFSLGDPATYYEITTTATYSGFITVCIDYSEVQYFDEATLRLYHGEGDPADWVDVTLEPVDTENDIICGIVSSFSLLVVVEQMPPPVELVQALIDHVEALNLQHGIANSLDAKLERAQDALSDLNQNNDVAAINALEAFINEVEAQSGDKIPAEAAAELIGEAQVIIDLLTQGGGNQTTGTPRALAELPVLFQNTPNPFSGETAIQFSLPDSRDTRLSVYDVAGRTVEVLVNEELPAGVHTVNWNTDVPAGMYFCRMQAGSLTHMKKMVVLK